MTKYKIGDRIVMKEVKRENLKPHYSIFEIKDITFKQIKNIDESGEPLYIRRYEVKDVWRFNESKIKLKYDMFTDIVDSKVKDMDGFFLYHETPEIKEVDQSKIYTLNENFKMSKLPIPLCTVISVEDMVKVRWLVGSNSIAEYQLEDFKKYFSEYLEQ